MTDKRWTLKPSRDDGYELAWIDDDFNTAGWWISGEQARALAASVVPEEPEAVGYYVIPKADNPDQDSLWDGTIHPTPEAAQASIDEARPEWGQDAENYRVVALVPVEQEGE